MVFFFWPFAFHSPLPFVIFCCLNHFYYFLRSLRPKKKGFRWAFPYQFLIPFGRTEKFHPRAITFNPAEAATLKKLMNLMFGQVWLNDFQVTPDPVKDQVKSVENTNKQGSRKAGKLARQLRKRVTLVINLSLSLELLECLPAFK